MNPPGFHPGHESRLDDAFFIHQRSWWMDEASATRPDPPYDGADLRLNIGFRTIGRANHYRDHIVNFGRFCDWLGHVWCWSLPGKAATLGPLFGRLPGRKVGRHTIN